MSKNEPPRQVIREAKAILTTHIGRNNAITSQELSQRLGGVDTLDSTPNTRAIIREVMAEYNIPIAGSPDGYFIIESRTQYENAQRRLDGRIDGIADRKDILATAWARTERNDPQSGLEAYE